MKRLVAVLAVLSIVMTACSGSDEVVASVNGEDILRSEVDVLSPESDDEPVSGEFARFLSLTIQWEARAQAAFNDFGIDPTEDEVDSKLDELLAQQPGGMTLEELVEQASTSEEGIRQLTEQILIEDGVQSEFEDAAEPISDEAVNKELTDNPLNWTVVCASHILVETENEAITAAARLDAGEDFATIAQELSIDTGSGANGGELECGPPAGFVEEFATATMEAELDVVTEPVESQYGYHLILVTGREEATTEIVRESMQQAALVIAVEDWFSNALTTAEVTVDEEIGVWVTDPSPQVLTVN